jgi:hypothetical protein
MADDLIEERIRREAKPDSKRVRSRAKTIEHDQPEIDDAERSAERLLSESDSRTQTDPAPRSLAEDRVERRTSEDATPPPERVEDDDEGSARGREQPNRGDQ